MGKTIILTPKETNPNDKQYMQLTDLHRFNIYRRKQLQLTQMIEECRVMKTKVKEVAADLHGLEKQAIDLHSEYITTNVQLKASNEDSQMDDYFGRMIEKLIDDEKAIKLVPLPDIYREFMMKHEFMTPDPEDEDIEKHLHPVDAANVKFISNQRTESWI